MKLLFFIHAVNNLFRICELDVTLLQIGNWMDVALKSLGQTSDFVTMSHPSRYLEATKLYEELHVNQKLKFFQPRT